MSGEPRLRGRIGTTPKWCKRCGGRHAGGATQCNLVPIYSPAAQPPRWSRPEVAEEIEAYDDEREGR